MEKPSLVNCPPKVLCLTFEGQLTTTNLTIKEIADRYCFESASYLGRFFRKHSGMTPREYRNFRKSG